MRSFVLVSSLLDLAGRNIAGRLIESYSFKESGEAFEDRPVYRRGACRLIQVSEDLLHLEGLDMHFDPEAYIFLSRHRSESGIPTLTAHFPGNFSSDTSRGGRPRELIYTYPSLHKEYLRQLWSVRSTAPGYSVVTEPMHHGPTSLRKPVLYVEIGSAEEQWKDKAAVEAVCEALIKTLDNFSPAEKIAVGFGGTHYSEKFTRLIIDSEYALGAIAPKYAVQYIDKEILRQMIEKSVEKVSYAAIDWKGVKEKQSLMTLIEEAGLEVVKT